MIVRWRAVGSTEFVGVWQDCGLVLSWSTEEHSWIAKVDGVRVYAIVNGKQQRQWTSAGHAMDAVDAVITKLLLKTSVQAQQKPHVDYAALGLVVRHGGA